MAAINIINNYVQPHFVYFENKQYLCPIKKAITIYIDSKAYVHPNVTFGTVLPLT